MNVYPITFSSAKGPIHAQLVTDVTLPTDFWTLVPAGNGTEYSGYPGGNPPNPVWSAVPNFLNQSTSLSVNILTTYITPTSGCTCVLNGSLPAGWSFNGTLLTYDGSTVNSSATTGLSFTAKLTSTGVTSNSNQFSVQGAGSPTSDTVAPCIPVALAATSNTVAGGVVIGGPTPSDPNQTGHTWSGDQQINVTRTPPGSVIGHTSVSAGNQPIFGLQDIGSPSPVSTFSQSGANITLTTYGDLIFSGSDQFAFAPQQLTGTSWTHICKISAFTSTYSYSFAGLMARSGLNVGDTGVFVLTTPFSPGNGVNFGNRASANTAWSFNAYVANSIAPVWLMLIRSGDTYTAYYSLDAKTFTQIGTSVTQIMGSTLYVGPALTSNVNALQVSCTFQQVSLQTLANWSYTDSSVVAGTAYTYQVTCQDSVPNVSALSASLNVTAASSGKVKWNPGHYMNTGLTGTCLGNKDFSGNDAGSQKLAEINVVRSGPAKVLGWIGYYTFRSFYNSGSIDCTTAGSGFDADYTAITGYVSGSTTNAVYNSPRRMGLNIIFNDFFSSAPTRVVPDFITSSSTYGPVGPDGSHYGYWTTNGGQGTATGATTATYRSAVMTQVKNFFSALASHVLPDGYTVDTSPYMEIINLYEETNTLQINGNTDSTYSTSGLVTQLEGLNTSAVNSFPHTNVVSRTNYIGLTGNDVSSYLSTFAAARVAFGGPDILQGLAEGNNVPQLTWGQTRYIGNDIPSSNPFNSPWTASGGKDLRGSVPCIAAEEGDFLTFGPFTSAVDLFNQANTTLHATHLCWGYTAGGATPAYANWFGNAGNLTNWNNGGDTANGVLTTIVDNALSTTAYPTSYP